MKAARGPLALAPLALLVAVSTAVQQHFAQRNHLRIPDEAIGVISGRGVADGLPASLWADQSQFFNRGPERLTAWVLGIVDALTPTTAGTFVVGHLVLALAMALVALPVAALARGLGLTWLQATVPAALCAAGPWALYGITFLNTALGLLTSAALLAVAWRVAARPGLRWELAVLVATAATVLARVGHAPLVLALAPALVAATWYGRPEGERLGAWARALPLRFARTWPILTAVGALGLVAVAVVGQARILGGYGSQITSQDLQIDRIWLQTRIFFSRAALATGMLPVLLGLPWLVRAAVRPATREAGIFAVLGISWLVVILYVFYTTGLVEDRYLAVMLPVLAVAFARALFARELWVLGTAVTAVLLGRAIAQVGLYRTDEPFSYLIAPSSRFFERVLMSKTGQVLPFAGTHVLTLLLVCAGLAAVAVAFALPHLRAGRQRSGLAVAVALGVMGYAAVAGAYAAQKFTAAVGRPDLSFEDTSFVDRVAGDRSVGAIAIAAQNDIGGVIQRYFDLSYFNASVRSSVDLDGRSAFACCAPKALPRVVMRSDRRTGAVTVLEGRQPPLYVRPLGYQPLGLNTRRIALGEPGFGVEQPLTKAPRLSFVARGGTSLDGWGIPDRAVRRRVFPPAAGALPACWEATLTAAALVPGDRQRFTVTGGRTTIRGTVAARTSRVLTVPLPRTGAVELRIRATPAGTLDDLRPVTVMVGDDHVVPCRGRQASARG